MGRFGVALGIGACAVVGLGGCGDDEVMVAPQVAASTTGSGSGGMGGSGGGGQGGEGPTCTETGGVVLAINKVFFGDKNTDGTADSNAWQGFGFNVDGLTSTAMSTDVCKPNSGGMASMAYPDGKDGIDNSFGKNVVPIFLGFDKNFTQNANNDIQEGAFTVLFRMDDLGPEADAPAFVTKLYVGGDLGEEPAFDGTDCWPVIPSLLDDPGDIGSSKVVFEASSASQNVWTSGLGGTLLLTFPAAGDALLLSIHEARLSMELDADHKGAINGQIGGVLETEELAAEVKRLAGRVNPVLCSGAIIDDILTKVRQASDSMKDGTQDPSAVCDGISIGLGFEVKSVMLGGIAKDAEKAGDPCGM